ncbi:MAG: UpxY family transcription antiterminator [Chitinophagales bacterium]|nr:UpxY family transcription antiterminator [Chitinophagales bacterium]
MKNQDVMIHHHNMVGADHNWYVLYVKPKSERKVGERLKSLGFEVCVPTQKIVRQWSDRKKVIEVVVFPNYVFVASDSKRRNMVFEVGNVFKFVQFGGRAAVLTEKDIHMVQQLGNQPRPVTIDYEGFGIGEEVEIISGSLTGYKGIIKAVNGNSRIKLALPSLCCFASVELNGVEVRKINLA